MSTMLEAVMRGGLVIGVGVIIALATRLSELAFFAIALTICCVLGATLWTRCIHACVRARLAESERVARSGPPSALAHPRRDRSRTSRRTCGEWL